MDLEKLEDINEKEVNVEIVLEEELDEKDYSETNTLYRNKLRTRLLIIFISTLLIIVTRAFPTYSDFDVVMKSELFLAMFTITITASIVCFFYLANSKNTPATSITTKLNKRLLEVFDLFSIIPIFIALMTISNAFILSPATVDGESMEPTFFDGEDVLIEHFNLNLEIFDVVILKVDNGDYYIKRVIGMPGDMVIIDHNQITVNGVLIEQSFIEDENGSMLSYTYCNNALEEVCEFDVPENYYFVLGDNREHSTDSRSNSLGFVSEDAIYGKVIFKFNNIIRNFLK